MEMMIKIKIRFLIIIVMVGIVVSGSTVYLYDQMYDCLNHPLWIKHPRNYGIDDCLQMYYDGTLPDYTVARKNYEEKIFNREMEKKATLAFNMTLTSYGIIAEKLTVNPGIKTTNEFYMAQAVAENSTRYFLMSSFEKDEHPDKIKVDLFEIISDGCTNNDILNFRGCHPDTIREVGNEN